MLFVLYCGCPVKEWSLSIMFNGCAPDGFGSTSRDPDRLTRFGGVITGFASTYSRALNASRAEIIDAVEREVEPLVLVNGNRGTDHAGASTNRTRSPGHPDCDGVDQVFIAVTPAQFATLAAQVGADVRVETT